MKQSGDVGYCKLAGHTAPLLRTWENDTIISVDCGTDGYDYKNCGYANVCEIIINTSAFFLPSLHMTFHHFLFCVTDIMYLYLQAHQKY